MANPFENGLLIVPSNAELIHKTDVELQAEALALKEGLYNKFRSKKNELVRKPFGGRTPKLGFSTKPITNPLFPKIPDISQIEQGNHGHCYFSAAILSILTNTPLQLMECMRDNGDNTVTVRLYDEKGNPNYYLVDKSELTPSDEKDVPFHHGADWFSILLKAYGIHTQRHESAIFSTRKTNNVVERISGGFSADVFTALCGVPGSINMMNDYIKSLTGGATNPFNFLAYQPTPKEKAAKLYEALKNLLDQGAEIAVATVRELKDGEVTYNKTEARVKGILLNHAYGVLDVIQREDGYFVRTANPWQKVALRYQLDEEGKARIPAEFNKKEDHIRYSINANQRLGKKIEGGDLLGTTGIDGVSENYSGVSEINLLDAEKFFLNIDICPHKRIDDVAMNQLYLILQHAITFSGNQESANTEVSPNLPASTELTDEIALPENKIKSEDADIPFIAKEALATLINPALDTPAKLRALAYLNLSSPQLEKIQNENPIFNRFCVIMNGLKNKLEELYEKFPITGTEAQKKEQKDHIKLKIKDLVRDEIFPEIKKLNAEIKTNVISKLMLIKELFDIVTNDCVNFPYDIYKEIEAIRNDTTSSLRERIKATKGFLDSLGDDRLSKIPKDLQIKISNANSKIDEWVKEAPAPLSAQQEFLVPRGAGGKA